MKWQYRKVEVVGDEIIDIPAGSKSIQVRPVSRSNSSYVEWLEPIKEDVIEYPTYNEKKGV